MKERQRILIVASAFVAFVLWLAALTAMGSQPQGEPVQDRVDLVEVNHFHDGCGKRVFDQLIWWTWRPSESEFRVVAWRLYKSDGQRPRLNHATGDWVSRWHDGETFREVRAATFKQSWTQHDPEVIDRDFLPKEQRKELAKP